MASSARSRTLMFALAALALPALAHAAPAGDKAKGEATFKAMCSACHSVVDDAGPRPAPSLKGLVGRPAASLATFKGYSPALKASGKTWTTASLDEFLTLPSKAVPGTFMVINLSKPDQRADVIAYLASLK